MIFFYNGFKLDINTKKWLPDKNTNIYSLSNKKDIRIDKYDFQKEFIDIDNNNALKIPKNILNSDIYNEYEYIFNTKKYNI